MRANRPDLLIVGGGLSGALIALAMARWQPDVAVELVERDDHFGGNHIWSFFASDIDADGAALLAPMIAQRWEGYDIAFPARRRTLDSAYASITSATLDAHLRDVLGSRARGGIAINQVASDAATAAEGAVWPAAAVIDARGAGVQLDALSCGWQKFVGQMLELEHPHGLQRPIVMDATVAQIDGFRFVYVLPFGPDRLFVEDTYYSDTPTMDRDAVATRIASYAAEQGWSVRAVAAEEGGALPVVKGGRLAQIWDPADRVARAGVGAGLFHPTTGYSLPHAVDFAIALAKAWPIDDIGQWSRHYAARTWAGAGFYRLLDRMLFDAAAPERRYRVLEHFYRLPAPLVERFYAGKSTLADRMRILSGRPPVPIGAAVRAILRGAGSG